MKKALLFFLLVGSTARSQGWDIQRQDVNLDLAGSTLSLELTASLKATRETNVFDILFPNLVLQSVEFEGMSLALQAHPDYPQYLKRVTLPRSFAVGEVAMLKGKLTGPLQCKAANSPFNFCISTPQATIMLPASYEAPWYFVNPYETDDPFVSEMTIRAPTAHTVVAGQGRGTVNDLGDGTRRWTYKADHPNSSLFVVAAEMNAVSSTEAEFTVTGHFKNELNIVDEMKHATDLASKVLPFYAQAFGDLPVHDVHLIATPPTFSFGGLGMLGNVLLADVIFLPDLAYMRDIGVCHELAHSWWGNLTSGANDNERGFLSEAFAEYSAWRALGHLNGEGTRTTGNRMNAVWFMYRLPAGQDIAPLATDVDRSPAFVWVTYHKGSVVLRTLAELAGEETFTQALRALVKYPPATASVAALVTEVKNAGGPDLTDAVDRWLNNKGFAKIGIAPTLTESNVHWVVTCEGPCPLQLPVVLRSRGGGTETRTLDVQRGTTRFDLALTSDLEAIEVDPRWTMVREVNPAVGSDVTLDGVVDGRDLLDVALRVGTSLPTERRRDGYYDPLFDVNRDRAVNLDDLEAVVAAVQ